MSSESMTLPGRLNGRYQLGELLGRGGMGEVHAGWDQVLDRPVAIKLLRPDVASDPTVRRRFEAEARSAARLVHPNVVQVYDSGEDSGIPFMVMERLPGRSLRDEIKTGPMEVPRVCSMALQVLAALEAAHRANLVHRDIKPGNILLGRDGTWKVGDFGIAKSLQPAQGDETVTGVVLGTPAYLPPERLLGGEATPAGDLYALGVILYEALSGRKPFEAITPQGQVTVSSSGPLPLWALRPVVPPALAAAVEKSIAWEPGIRFSTAAEMAASIRAADEATERGLPLDARTGGWEGWMAVPPAGQEVATAAGTAEETILTVGPGTPTRVLWASDESDPRSMWAGRPSAGRPSAGRPSAGRLGLGFGRLGLAVIAVGVAVLLLVALTIARGSGTSHHPPATPVTVAQATAPTTAPTTLPATSDTTVAAPQSPAAAKHQPGSPPPGHGSQAKHDD